MIYQSYTGAVTTTRQPPTAGPGPGAVLAVVMDNADCTRSAIESLTGLSRPTVTERLRTLSAAGLIHKTNRRVASGGRPATVYEFQPRAYVSLCVDIGEVHTRVAIADLRNTIIEETVLDQRVSDGPQAVLATIIEAGRQLLASRAVKGDRLGGIGVGLPAPVDFATGRTVGWSIMSGWEGYEVREHLAAEFDVPVFVDNDVNLLTLAEHRLVWPEESHLMFIKAGTGIGSGFVVDGRINRGSLGAAGDIGHARIAGYGDPVCRCGNRGCLEALAGGWAMARELRLLQSGEYDGVMTARDVVSTVRRGAPEAMALIRDAGRILGEAVAFATSLLNPAVIVIGGELARAGDQLMAGVRELVYSRSLPLATKDLNISLSRLDESAGVIGAAFLVSDALLAPERLDRVLRATGPAAS